MRSLPVLLSVAVVWGGSACAQTSRPSPQFAQLEGRWVVAHRAFTPSKKTADVASQMMDLGTEVEFVDGKLVACDKGKQGASLSVQFDPSLPSAIDLKVPGGDDKQALQGLYRIDGDILILTVGTGERRPQPTDTPASLVRLILKRKPAQP